MDIGIENVHIGEAIKKHRNELGLSKSELGRKIGVPQQRVNRILGRETMEAKRLIKISEALGLNFFTLFCPVQHQISAYLAAVTLDGNAHNTIGDIELASQLAKAQTEIESQRGTIALLKEQVDSLNAQINRLDSSLRNKDTIIELLKERR